MAENYKHLYEQTKKMLTKYQDELIPGFHKQIEELESTVVHQRKRADTAENFICTMCSECDYEVNDGILIMQKHCCSLFPLECGKFKLRPGWIPVTERLPDEREVKYKEPAEPSVFGKYLASNNVLVYTDSRQFAVGSTCDGQWDIDCSYDYETVTHWMPLPEPPKEEEDG